MKKIMVYALLLTTLLSGCSKLPRETRSGKNTFGCKIDGKVFKPCESSGLFTTDPLYGGVTTNPTAYAGVGAHCYEHWPRRDVGITINNFRGVGEYKISGYDVRGTYQENYIWFDSNPAGSGKVIITKDDRQNRILSGTFEFTAQSSNNPNETVTITDGRFDINY